MSKRLTFIACVAALTAAFVVAASTLMSAPAAAQEPAYVTPLDEIAFAMWPRHATEAQRAIALQVDDSRTIERDRPHVLPPVDDWYGDIRICEADHNPPEGFTRFGGFCDQTKYPDRQSLMFQGTDAIFGFKG